MQVLLLLLHAVLLHNLLLFDWNDDLFGGVAFVEFASNGWLSLGQASGLRR